jgi:hypothetical protein
MNTHTHKTFSADNCDIILHVMAIVKYKQIPYIMFRYSSSYAGKSSGDKTREQTKCGYTSALKLIYSTIMKMK